VDLRQPSRMAEGNDDDVRRTDEFHRLGFAESKRLSTSGPGKEAVQHMRQRRSALS